MIFLTHLGVEGFIIYGWDLSNLGYTPYMTNLGDKSHMIIIRDVFHHSTVVNRGPYSTKPSDKLRPIRFFTSGWDLSYVGGFVIYGWGLSYLGGICQIWALYNAVLWIRLGFVKYGLRFVKYGLAHKGQYAIITQTLVFRVPGFVT